MRTTLAIDDHLLEAAKREAHERHITLGHLVEAALRRELAEPTEESPPPEVPVFTGGTGVQPGIDLHSNRALYELLDEEDIQRGRIR